MDFHDYCEIHFLLGVVFNPVFMPCHGPQKFVVRVQGPYGSKDPKEYGTFKICRRSLDTLQKQYREIEIISLDKLPSHPCSCVLCVSGTNVAKILLT